MPLKNLLSDLSIRGNKKAGDASNDVSPAEAVSQLDAVLTTVGDLTPGMAKAVTTFVSDILDTVTIDTSGAAAGVDGTASPRRACRFCSLGSFQATGSEHLAQGRILIVRKANFDQADL